MMCLCLPLLLRIDCERVNACPPLIHFPAPRRDFTPGRLVLPPEDLPPDWHRKGVHVATYPYRVPGSPGKYDHLHDIITHDFAIVGDHNRPLVEGRYSIVRFDYASRFNFHAYAEIAFAGGSRWRDQADGPFFVSPYADDARLACTSIVDACRYLARYDEFLLTFLVEVSPGQGASDLWPYLDSIVTYLQRQDDRIAAMMGLD